MTQSYMQQQGVHPYNQMYLSDAMTNLAEAFDTAVRYYELSLDLFMQMMIRSGVARQFENGNPKYVSGYSGPELVEHIICKVSDESYDVPNYTYNEMGVEYWTGWIVAYYQWRTFTTFKEIQRHITMRDISLRYHPYHEMDEEKMVEYIDNVIADSERVNRLQAYRKLMGLSQSELSREAGINLRTLQQYEIGVKDLGKASVSTVLSLSNVLKCDVNDIL